MKILKRILVFPFKLAFLLAWYNLNAVIHSVIWVAYGGQELLSIKDKEKSNIDLLIESNQELIKYLRK